MRILRPLLLALLLSPLAACFDLYTRPAEGPDEPTDLSSHPREDGFVADMANLPFVQKSYDPNVLQQESLAAVSEDTNIIITSRPAGSETYIKCYTNKPNSTEWRESCKFDSDLEIPVSTNTGSGFLAVFLPNGFLLVARKRLMSGNKEYIFELYSISNISKNVLTRVNSDASPFKVSASSVRTIRLSPDAQRIFIETYPDSGTDSLSQVVSINTPRATP